MSPMLALLLGAAIARSPLTPTPEGPISADASEQGPHPWAQTEWWHVHADLIERATGAELHVFAAFLVERTANDRVAGIPVSALLPRFHTAYVRLATDDRAWDADREGFPDGFVAGFRPATAEIPLDVHHGDWRLTWEHGTAVLSVSAGPERVAITLTPTRGPTLPGDGGRVELPVGHAHDWMQYERMAVTGTWREHGRERRVEGTGFYKHQWGRLYDPAVSGFEWASFDLADGRSLAVAWVDGGGSRGVPGSLAFWSTPDGATIPIDPAEVTFAQVRSRHSRRSGASWPVAWDLTAPGIALRVTSLRDDQELWTFPAAIYAGPALFSGTVDGASVDGLAFVEQVGAQAPRFRFLYRSEAP